MKYSRKHRSRPRPGQAQVERTRKMRQAGWIRRYTLRKRVANDEMHMEGLWVLREEFLLGVPRLCGTVKRFQEICYRAGDPKSET